jgi:anti-sigma B factor antagonist
MTELAGRARVRRVPGDRRRPSPCGSTYVNAAGTVVAVSGDLDLNSSPALSRRLREILASQPTTLTLDLAGVTFMDSSGLSALVAALHEADVRGVGFAIASVPEQAQRVLTLTDTTGLFHILERDGIQRAD